jgi:signal transduction histidine kinase
MASATGGEVATGSEPRLVAALLELASGEGALDGTPFSEVAHNAAAILGAEAAGVLRFLGEERGVIVGVWRAGGTRGMPVNAEVDFDRRDSAIGRARSTGAPARMDSYKGRRGELPVVMDSIGLRSSVAAPILLEAGPWGAVVVATAREEPLPAESEQRLGALAELLARAVAGGEARRALEDSRQRVAEGADQARRQLERELHEGPHQLVLALTLKLRVARSQAENGSKLAGLLDDAIAGATETDAALRDLARRMFPVILRERGLAAAVQAVAVRAAVPVHLRRLPSRRFPAMVEASAYFAIAGALASAAGEASVVVADEGDRISIEVRDAGGGALAGSDGERVAAAGGSLVVESAPEGGTVMRAVIPLERPLRP